MVAPKKHSMPMKPFLVGLLLLGGLALIVVAVLLSTSINKYIMIGRRGALIVVGLGLLIIYTRNKR